MVLVLGLMLVVVMVVVIHSPLKMNGMECNIRLQKSSNKYIQIYTRTIALLLI
jgi:hypothetical protein